jgi:hypothetical protein
MSIQSESFRYNTSGQWYKGNTHIHSRASDGGKTFVEIEGLYAGAGYDFLFATDHGVASRVEQEMEASSLLWLDGIEINGQDHTGAAYHVVCLGTVNGITPEILFIDAMQSARDQNALLILAHPFWSGNTLEDATRWDFDGVEIYNHVCHWLNGKGDGRVHWDAMLRHKPNTLAFSADDAHLRPEHPGWNGGWIVVNAEERSKELITRAIRRGSYYSSCGPEFHTIALDGENVVITTSPVQFVRLVGPGFLGARLGSFDGQEMHEASFILPAEWDYVYVEIEDRKGQRAWTNTLFVTDRSSNRQDAADG